MGIAKSKGMNWIEGLVYIIQGGETSRRASLSAAEIFKSGPLGCLRRSWSRSHILLLHPPRLNGTRDEGKAIAVLAGPERSMLYLDFRFQAGTLLSPSLGAYKILNLASNGVFDESMPFLRYSSFPR